MPILDKITAQYVNCAAANPGADAGMYDASEQYKLSTGIDCWSKGARSWLSQSGNHENDMVTTGLTHILQLQQRDTNTPAR